MSDKNSPTELSAEQTIRDELEKIAGLITASRHLMTEGRSVDLSAVEERVRIITEAVTEAPPEIASTFKEHLEALFDILNSLQDDLEQSHQTLQDKLKFMARRTATDAYGALPSTPTSTPVPDSDED